MVSSPVGHVPQFDASGSLIMRATKTEDVNATGSGNTELVAAVSGFKIRVIGCVLTNRDSSVVNVKFQSAANDITGSQAHTLAANGGGWARDAQSGAWLFETVAGEALNINLSAVSDVSVDITYYEA